MKHSIAVLLTVYNRREITLKCLEALYNQDLQDSIELDIFLTDDGSTDGTSDAVRTSYPLVNICDGNGSLFWNRGMHMAWERAASKKNYDYYLWVNDDTHLINNAIQIMIKESESFHDRSIIVGAVCDTVGSNITTYSGYDFQDNRITPNGQSQECSYFNGNIVLIPSFVYDKVGNLNYFYNHGLGDFDYGYRAHDKGIISYVTQVFLGSCDRHNKLPKWSNPNMPIKARLNNYFNSLGAAPIDNLYFNIRYRGLYVAFKSLFLSFANCIFPSLFYRRNMRNNMYFQ